MPLDSSGYPTVSAGTTAAPLTLEIAPGVAPTGERGVLLIRRHPNEPTVRTFLNFTAASDLALLLLEQRP